MAASTPPMVTAGIDLAAQPANTAACVIEWSPDGARVTRVQVGLDDPAIVAFAAGEAACVGVDCPFGWPTDFADAIAAHHAGAPWPGRDRDQSDYRRLLRLRRTDEHVAARIGLHPLSASSSMLAITTMRWAAIMDTLAAQGLAVDRTGGGRFAEVYPAAALKCWGFTHNRYKGTAKRRLNLTVLLDALRARIPWLAFADGLDDTCRTVDHAFDALVCALVARAVACGLTGPPPAPLVDTARVEGWIHLPASGSLDDLRAGAAPARS